MSWSFEHSGTREAVVQAATENLDKLAASYSGKEEGNDLVAIKERVLALVGALDLTSDGVHGVLVKGYGSHSIGSAGLWSANFSLQVSRTHLKP
jgi:hypothetical protein